MNKKIILSSIVFIQSSLLIAQSFAPAAGQPGSTAIHKDSSIIVNWAKTCEVERGYMNIEDPSLGYVSFGEPSNAVGPASGVTTSVVSLGDGGKATLTFNPPIKNGEGPDFAVFENGLNDQFLELGFVEVSSDGVNFVRFPAISEVQTTTQIGGFGSVDCRYIHNFAGKYRVAYGTPFDLEDLKDSNNIDLNAITHVRIVDVVGSINPLYATYDSQGNIINNLHPTPFESGGFDLDGIGVINEGELSLDKFTNYIGIYPNPVINQLTIATNKIESFSIVNTLGETLLKGSLTQGENMIDVSDFKTGIYFIHIGQSIQKITKQ